MDFKDLIDICQAEALANKLSPTEVSVWRSLCRKYSKRFNTPLPQVEMMAPRQVILAVYEDQLEEVNVDEHLDDMMEAIGQLEDPNYEQNREAAMDEFERQALAEEAERIAAGRPVHPSLRNEPSLSGNSLPKNPMDKPEKKPTEGFIDLSYLEKEEQ